MKKALILLPIVATVLGGCVGKKHYDAKEYMIPLGWKTSEGDFKVLQLSDIHLSQSDNHEEHFALMDRTIKAAEPNLIVLNGDIFTYADKHVVNKVFSYIDSHNIPWTYTFGNHDDQGYYPDNYIPRLLTSGKYKHVLMKNLEDDDVTGRTNFVINLRDKDDSNKVCYQVFILDSHSYNFNTMGYDYIKQDQIDWYERLVNFSKKTYGEGIHVIPSSMYMHIGFPEMVEVWDQNKDKDHQEGLIIGDMEEWSGSPKEDPGFFKKIKDLNSTHSVHVAHDHANDSVMLHKNVYFCYGVHSTNRVYNDEKAVKFGGQVLKIDKTSKELTFKNYYVSYENNKVIETEGWAK